MYKAPRERHEDLFLAIIWTILWIFLDLMLVIPMIFMITEGMIKCRN